MKKSSLTTILISLAVIVTVIVISIFKKPPDPEPEPETTMQTVNQDERVTDPVEPTSQDTVAETSVPDDQLEPERSEPGSDFVKIVFTSTDELDVLISLPGHDHMVTDIQQFLNDNKLEHAKEVYVLEGSESFKAGVTYFTMRTDVTEGKISGAYVSKEDTFYFELID